MSTDKHHGLRVITVGNDTAQGSGEDRYPRVEVSLPTIAEWIEQNVGPIEGPYPYQQALIDAALDGGNLQRRTFLRFVPDDREPFDPRQYPAAAGIMDEVDAPDYVPTRPRFFIDVLTITGDAYLIPANRRGEWDAFDCQCEETSEALPVPDWAQPIEHLSHVEFEGPQEIFK